MKKVITVTMLVTLFITLTGCAAVFTGGRGKFRATSTPDGAEVWVNGEKMGVTPVTLRLKSKGEYTVVIKKEGYKDQSMKVTNKVGAGWVILDVVLGLVPVIVDAVTGSWYVLNEKSFNAVLEINQP